MATLDNGFESDKRFNLVVAVRFILVRRLAGLSPTN